MMIKGNLDVDGLDEKWRWFTTERRRLMISKVFTIIQRCKIVEDFIILNEVET